LAFFQAEGGESRLKEAIDGLCRSSSLAIKSDALDNAPDVFQTAEWFGSGGAADRLTLCSERFAELVSSSGWRGLEFRSVQANGWSERASQSI